jgi:hypothetical protein
VNIQSTFRHRLHADKASDKVSDKASDKEHWDSRQQQVRKSFSLPGRIPREIVKDFGLADVFPYGQSNRKPKL